MDNSRMEVPADPTIWHYMHRPVANVQLKQSGHTFIDIPFPLPGQLTANGTQHSVRPGKVNIANQTPTAAQQRQIPLHPGIQQDTFTDRPFPLPGQLTANGTQHSVSNNSQPHSCCSTITTHTPYILVYNKITSDLEDTDASTSSSEEDINQLGAKYMQKHFNNNIPSINVGHYAHNAEPISSPISLQI